MESFVIFIIVAICAGFVGKQMLGKAGIGKPGGKPDCGCGHCAERGRKKAENEILGNDSEA